MNIFIIVKRSVFFFGFLRAQRQRNNPMDHEELAKHETLGLNPNLSVTPKDKSTPSNLGRVAST